MGWRLPARAQADAKSFLAKVRTRIPSGQRAKSVVPFERKNVTRRDKTQLHVLIESRTTGGARNTRERRNYVDCGTYIDSVPREIFNALEATLSASANCHEELADRVSEVGSQKRKGKGGSYPQSGFSASEHPDDWSAMPVIGLTIPGLQMLGGSVQSLMLHGWWQLH